jgi:hypothetical protein
LHGRRGHLLEEQRGLDRQRHRRHTDQENLITRLFFAMVGSQIRWSNIGMTHPEPADRLAVMIADLLLDGSRNPQSIDVRKPDDILMTKLRVDMLPSKE